MLQTTLQTIRSVLQGDPSLAPPDRTRILVLVRNGLSPAKPETSTERVAKIIRRREVAERLSCSLRSVDKLASTGVLHKRKLPGRVRASGFLESDVAALIEGRAA